MVSILQFIILIFCNLLSSQITDLIKHYPFSKQTALISCMSQTFEKSNPSSYESILEQIPIPISILDKQLTIIFANIAFYELFKGNNAQLLGVSFNTLLCPECISGNIEKFKPLLSGNIDQFNHTHTYLDCSEKVFKANTQINKFPEQDEKYRDSYICFFNVVYQENENGSLQDRLDRKNRELLTSIIFISQRNTLLNSVVGALDKIAHKVINETIKREIFDVINHIKGNIHLEENWEKFNWHFEKVHPGFFTKLQKIAPNLTQKELKQCAYIRLGLNYKETALLLGITSKGVEMARYRIKKKLFPPDSGGKLGTFIRNL